MVSEKRLVRKINYLEIILGNLKRTWTLVPQEINICSCDGLSYPIHPKFRLLPIPHGGMSIYAMACHMKCDWLANFLADGWSLRGNFFFEVSMT